MRYSQVTCYNRQMYHHYLCIGDKDDDDVSLLQAQNIKNFKSQRWQTLLNFSSQRRLLLTGTPLQNNLMELWSLMHFLMPNVFQSHMEFKEWFANPLTGMIEGTSDYNEQLVRRLHKVNILLTMHGVRCCKTELESLGRLNGCRVLLQAQREIVGS